MRTCIAAVVIWAASLFFALALDLGVRSAQAQSPLELPAGHVWAVLASTQDREEAVAIAQFHAGSFLAPKVARARNGWLAVIAGPYQTQAPDRLRTELRSHWAAPSDLFLSNGAGFVETVWVDRPDPVEIVEFDRERFPGGSLRLRRSGYEIEISAVDLGDELFSPRLVLREEGRIVVDVTLDDSATDNANAILRFARLDPASRSEDLIFSSFWMGAHCCTVTRFVSRGENGWRVVEGGVLDGDIGYMPRDLDGDGVSELISVDNSFLYAFAPYAGSIAPPLVHSLRGGELVDRRFDRRIAHYYRREAFQLEYWARVEPRMWSENGFLAAWIATKAVLGDFAESWPRVLANYDRRSDWPLESCAVDLVDYMCPPGQLITPTFPEALRLHLEETGYIEARPSPQAVAARPAAVAPAATPPPPREPPASERAGAAAPGPARSVGTGFVIAPGRVLTNRHVVEECLSPSVRRDGASLPAREIASDAMNDLALLAVDGLDAPQAALRLSARLGESVAAFGFPLAPLLSSSGNFTLGNVTALSGLGDDTRFLQVSAPVQPGNSGGPLLDADGAVLGVVTSKLNALVSIALLGDVPQNVNFAVKSATVFTFLAAHGIMPAIETSPPSGNLPPEDLAVIAGGISVQIMCR